MQELLNWRDYNVIQDDKVTGCVPASYEYMFRYNETNIPYNSIQDIYDLKKNRDEGNSLRAL